MNLNAGTKNLNAGKTVLRSRRYRDARGVRGAVAVEYAMLLVMVAIPTIVGIVAGGVNLLNDYNTGRSAILAASP